MYLKECTKNRNPTCDFIIAFDDVLIRLSILQNNLNKGWFLSNIGASNRICKNLREHYAVKTL